jgi:phosphoglycerate dehydrogenase-like enzyme
MIHAAFLFSTEARDVVYTEAVMARLRRCVHVGPIVAPAHGWPEFREAFKDVQVVFSGWGAPTMDEDLLNALPQLKVVFYAGGSVRYFATGALWNRGIRLTTAVAINAVPVAEYTVAAILLGLKRFWHYARLTHDERSFRTDRPVPGAYHSNVGLISYGTIARLVRQRLRAHEVNVLVYDPLLGGEEASREKVRKVELDELFALSDVVSLHAPVLPETTGMITCGHFMQMKPGALFINTARGEIVNEPGMIAALRRRTDLYALLDVTAPEPPVAHSPLYTLPNVILTPHIAGSLGPECERMGHAMVDELERHLDGRPLLWEVTPERAATMA